MRLPHHSKLHLPWVARLNALERVAIVLALALIASLLLSPWLSDRMLLLAGWDVGALGYLGLGWMVVARTDETLTRVRAQLYDPSGFVIFLLVVTAASASVVAIGFMVGDLKSLNYWARAERLTLSVAALLLSWLLIHTTERARTAPPGAQVPRRRRTRLSGFPLLLVRSRHDLAGVGRRGPIAAHATAHADPRHPVVYL
jgi:hypothetical protein